MKSGIDIKRVLKFVKNKYFIVIGLFLLLILISDEASVFRYRNLYKQREELRKRKSFYENEIRKDSISIVNIQKNIEAAEKFGREKYLMKRDDEDIFIIRHADDDTLQEIQ